MQRKVLTLLITIFIGVNAFAINIPHGIKPDSIYDGPHFLILRNKLEMRWIENSTLRTQSVDKDNFPGIKKKFNFIFDYGDLTDTYNLKPEYNQVYKGISKIAAISDIHGEYKKYIVLLKSQGIIDDNLNWKFGKGHLAVIGDLFDRGNQVTEVLWHLFGLEKQAKKAGGMVHVLIGNHESMIMMNDTRYINEKYNEVEDLCRSDYSELYSDKSIIGKWLRNMPAIISINDFIFVHGGISKELILRDLSMEEINRIFSKMELGKQMQQGKELEDFTFLNDDLGPIWYRGYFSDKSFTEARIDSILKFYGKSHVVVGHTTSNEIRSLFNNKILGIDAGLGNRQPGEMIIIENGIIYKCYASGKRIKL